MVTLEPSGTFLALDQGATRRDESAGGQPEGRQAWFVGWLGLAR